MSRNFDAGLSGFSAEEFRLAAARQAPADLPAQKAWALVTVGSGLPVAAMARSVTHYQGYGDVIPSGKREP